MAINIDDIKFEEGTEMPVLHPTTGEVLKDEKGQIASIRLAGVDSDIYRKAANIITNRRVKGSRNPKMTAEKLDADTLELVCKCTLSWTGILIKEKVPKTAEELYTGAKWLRQQAEEWMHDRANYLGN